MASTITRESVGYKRLLFLWNNIKDFSSEVLKKGFQISVEVQQLNFNTLTFLPSKKVIFPNYSL